MIGYIECLNLPTQIAVGLIILFFVIQGIGELLEFKGKVVPEFVKIRKYFKRKKEEKKETAETLKAVKSLLNDVNTHYSEDNITKRNAWMQWVNDRATVYDDSIVELKKQNEEMKKQNEKLSEQLKTNTEITLDLYINVNRNRIIDFASRVVNKEILVSREEFNRIFKVYSEYEDVLDKYGKTNGEVDVAYNIIQEAYEEHMREHSFIEDIRGYVR